MAAFTFGILCTLFGTLLILWGRRARFRPRRRLRRHYYCYRY
jgi:hypothetical protein